MFSLTPYISITSTSFHLGFSPMLNFFHPGMGFSPGLYRACTDLNQLLHVIVGFGP